MVHVDLDDLWALRECYAIPFESEDVDSHLYQQALPVLLDLFDKHCIRATFFVVGKDLESPFKVDLLKQALNAQHHVSSHSFSHRLDWKTLTVEDKTQEIVKTEDLIKNTLGCSPKGFRAPGYAYDPVTVEILSQRGYLYDSSLMPSYWGPVFRWKDKKMTLDRRRTQKTQFPSMRDGFRPLAPFHPVDSRSLIELPVATSPILRLPVQMGVCAHFGLPWVKFHLSYIKRRKDPFVMLIHLADIADFSTITNPFFHQNAYFSKSQQEKIDFIEQTLELLKTGATRLVTTEEYFTNESA